MPDLPLLIIRPGRSHRHAQRIRSWSKVLAAQKKKIRESGHNLFDKLSQYNIEIVA